MQLSNKIVSHLRSELKSRGASDIFVFTKRSNREIFASLAFHPIAQSDDAVLLESSARGVSSFCEKLSAFACDGKNGCIVMNANPFTLGHRYLAEAAARSDDAAKSVFKFFIIFWKEPMQNERAFIVKQKNE